jgi:hypothetical protein
VWHKPAAPKGVLIPAEWFALMPGQPLVFWMQVAKMAKTKRIRRGNLAGVKALAHTIHTK